MPASIARIAFSLRLSGTRFPCRRAFSAANTFSAATDFSEILGLTSLFFPLEEGRDLLLEEGRLTFVA
jgi:hypothetical protein